MGRFYSYVLFILCLLASSCKETNPADRKNEQRQLRELLKKNSEEQKKTPDLSKRLKFWKSKMSDARYRNDSVASSIIHYNIAGVFYGLNELDSVKRYMQVAWELMEYQTGFDAEKVLLYSGLGNIASLEHKLNQENYYYNRAGQMLLNDSTIDLTPKQKVTIYLAAAQSGTKLRQFSGAFKFNRKALSLLSALPDENDLKFRTYSQMALAFFNSNGNLDSLYSCIQKMQALHDKFPDFQKATFLADRKTVYFERKNLKDSMVFYQKKKMRMDVQDAMENGINAKSIRSGNLFLSYSDLCSYFLSEKMTDSGLFYLKKCENYIRKYPGLVDEQSVMLYKKNLVSYLFASKQYVKAEAQQEALLQASRSFYEAENARAIAEMSTVAELQAKDKSISNLNTTVGLAQQKLQDNRLWLAVTALTTLLALSLVFLLYYVQRQRKLRTENEKTQLEQRLLRTQMEPHFIFNTLSALQSFVRFDEKEKALKYLNKFSFLLRSSLELSRESYVALNQEIETLENYLSLQQMRYDSAFEYQLTLEDGQEDLGSIYIPPMLMQPFVENALLHGIDPNGKNGKINIDFAFRKTLLVVTISDNGKGIGASAGGSNHKSLSTTISKERLEIMAEETGLPAGIVIRSKINEGTEIIITIPVKSVYDMDNKIDIS